MRIEASSGRRLPALILLAVAAAFWLQWPRIADPYTVEEDFRSSFWMHRFQDRSLFEKDPTRSDRIAEIDVGKLHLTVDTGSLGYSLLFYLASFAVPVTLFSKLLVFPLIVISVVFLFRIGRKVRGEGTAVGLSLAFVVLNLASPTSISVVGGLQRSFACPLLLAVTYYLLDRSYKKAAIILFLCGLVYPPIFAVGAMTTCLSIMGDKETGSWTKKAAVLAPTVAVGLMVMAILAPMAYVRSSYAAGGTPTAIGADVGLLSNPKHQSGGQRQLFDFAPAVGRGGITTGGINILHIAVLSALSLVIIRQRPERLAKLPVPLKMLPLASFVGYALAWMAALLTGYFILYLPSRYTQASLFLFALVFVVVNAEEALGVAVQTLSRLGPRLLWIAGPLAAAAVGVAFLAQGGGSSHATGWGTSRWLLLALSGLLIILTTVHLGRRSKGTKVALRYPRNYSLTEKQWLLLGALLAIPSALYVAAVKSPFYTASPEERELFQFIETLPKHSRFAGHPCSLDSIALFTRREVLFSCENLHPDADVVLAGLEAFFADSPSRIIEFCTTYEVDYLVVDIDWYSRAFYRDLVYYFEPYDSLLQQSLENHEEFVLRSVVPERILFQSNSLFVASCEPRLFESVQAAAAGI